VAAQFANSALDATVAIGDNDIWAVGESNPNTSSHQPLAVHFDGTCCSVVPTPTINKGGSYDGAAAGASGDAWAVGTRNSQPLIEHWDGTSWSIVSSPKLKQGGALISVTAIAPNNVWAVGFRDDFSGDLVEHWDGSSWTLLTTPNGVSGMNGVAALSDGTVVIVSSSGAILEN
jgi:hypothetical protein